MDRRLPLLLLAALALALGGCAGDDDGDDGGAAKGDRAEATAAVERFLVAVQAGQTERAWNLLARSEREDPDFTFADFEASLPQIRQALRPFSNRGEPTFSADLGTGEVVTALTVEGEDGKGPSNVYVVATRQEDEQWRLEFGSLLGVDNPRPDDRGERPVVAFWAFKERESSKITDGRIWVDGERLAVTRRDTTARAIFAGRPRQRLENGRHTVVAFARVDDQMSVLGWALEMPRPPRPS